MDDSAINTLLSKLSDGPRTHANPFTSYNPREFDSMAVKPNHSMKIGGETPTCELCGTSMSKFDIRFVCETCGCEEEILGDDTDAAAEYYARGGSTGSNTTGVSSAPLRICGPNAHVLQQKLIGSVSNYKIQQKKATVAKMVNTVYHYNGAKIPNDVILAAAELYYDVQQCEIHRGEVQAGTMAACLYRKCNELGITRKPQEIADIFGISRTAFSFGDKILDRLIADGKLDMIQKQQYFNVDAEVLSLAERYMEDLDFASFSTPEQIQNYVAFISHLIKFTLDKHIADSSVPSSKCVGAIYLLTSKLELPVSWNDIQARCKISKSTFARYTKSVLDALGATCGSEIDMAHLKVCSVCRTSRQLRHIFKKYSINV